MWIKVCGICDVETARAVAAAGVDAIGLNFYEHTPRRISVETAAAVVNALPENVEPVAVFVNHSLSDVLSICQSTGIRTVQLHGDEPAEFLIELRRRDRSLRILRACRMEAQSSLSEPGRVAPDRAGTARLGEGEGMISWQRYLHDCRRQHAEPDACLIDAHAEDRYGGSGQTVAWDRLAAEYRLGEWPPLILAGGLRPENVAAAIAAVRPWGVDAASGVESAPARKDPAKVARFVAAVRGAE
ncbi:MAG: phosphoribosylanthranilate isomerase, partial [Planctomycetaceae bacterium]